MNKKKHLKPALPGQTGVLVSWSYQLKNAPNPPKTNQKEQPGKPTH